MRLFALGLFLFSVASGVALSAEDGHNRTERADDLIRQGRTGEAIAFLRSELLRTPDWREGLWRLAGLLYGTNEFSGAEQALHRLTQQDAQQGAPWVLLGMCDFETRDYAGAIRHLERGMALGVPSELGILAPAMHDYALALLAAGQFDRAHTVIQGISQQRDMQNDSWELADGLSLLRYPILPPDAEARLSPPAMAALRRAGDLDLRSYRQEIHDEAEVWEVLVQAYPDVPGIHYAFAKILLDQPDNKRAEREFRAELIKRPKDTAAKLGVVFALMQQQRQPEAITLVQEVIEADPGSANAHYLLGTLLVRQGQYAAACRELKTSVRLDPGLSRVHYSLAQVYLKLGKKDAAERERAEYVRLMADEDSFAQSGRYPRERYSAAGAH